MKFELALLLSAVIENASESDISSSGTRGLGILRRRALRYLSQDHMHIAGLAPRMFPTPFSALFNTTLFFPPLPSHFPALHTHFCHLSHSPPHPPFTPLHSSHLPPTHLRCNVTLPRCHPSQKNGVLSKSRKYTPKLPPRHLAQERLGSVATPTPDHDFREKLVGSTSLLDCSIRQHAENAHESFKRIGHSGHTPIDGGWRRATSHHRPLVLPQS